jgi:membrane protease YdiL (CAAX protease family)
VTAPREREATTVVALPSEREAPPADAGATPARRSRPGVRLLRGALAVLFWGAAQGAVAVPPAFVGAALGLLVGAGFLWWYVGRRDYPGERRRRATLRLRSPGPVLAWVAPVLVLAIGFAGASLVLAARVLPLPQSDTFEYFERMPFGWVPFTVLAVWLAPMMEEFLFRGWLQRNLERRLPAMRAVLLTALIFAVAHMDLFGLPSRFVVGAASGYLAYASGSIVPSVLLHAAYNGTLLLADHLPGTADDAALVRWARAPEVLVGAAALALASASGLVWALRRAGAQAAAHRAGRRDVGGAALPVPRGAARP